MPWLTKLHQCVHSWNNERKLWEQSPVVKLKIKSLSSILTDVIYIWSTLKKKKKIRGSFNWSIFFLEFCSNKRFSVPVINYSNYVFKKSFLTNVNISICILDQLGKHIFAVSRSSPKIKTMTQIQILYGDFYDSCMRGDIESCTVCFPQNPTLWRPWG